MQPIIVPSKAPGFCWKLLNIHINQIKKPMLIKLKWLFGLRLHFTLMLIHKAACSDLWCLLIFSRSWLLLQLPTGCHHPWALLCAAAGVCQRHVVHGHRPGIVHSAHSGRLPPHGAGLERQFPGAWGCPAELLRVRSLDETPAAFQASTSDADEPRPPSTRGGRRAAGNGEMETNSAFPVGFLEQTHGLWPVLQQRSLPCVCHRSRLDDVWLFGALDISGSVRYSSWDGAGSGRAGAVHPGCDQRHRPPRIWNLIQHALVQRAAYLHVCFCFAGQRAQ